MATHHLFVLAVKCDDESADRLSSVLHDVSKGWGGPVPCNWAPDSDTVADGLGVGYDDLEIWDLNPIRVQL